VQAAADRPLYRPYRWAAADFQLGLRPMRPETWILVGAEHAEMMKQKRERLDRFQGFYYGSLPDSLPAQRELRERVTAHLLTDHADIFERRGSSVVSRQAGEGIDLDDDSKEPLLQLSYLVEEDFMLLDQVGGAIRITAASNAYSSSGRLVAAVGHGMEWAHERVPQLTSKLGPRIERVLGSIHANAPTERFNWQITPLATVFFPHGDPHAANAAAMHEVLDELRRDPARAGERLWMRAERQTLRRLPDSGAVAFSLHTYSDPLSCLEHDTESIRAILKLLEGYSEERWHYSEMDIVREPLMAWLHAAAGTDN
jgi:heme-dependent oxidative N-demethylase alpha subunit-like protein